MLRRLAALAVLVGAGLAAVTTSPASAAGAVPLGAVGTDVSHPQCPVFPGQALIGLPTATPFAIVGVNDGVATGTNACLEDELGWAATATAGGSGSRIAVYANTADPGTASARWPRTATLGAVDPYGACTAGSAGEACAFEYGWALAAADLGRASLPAGTTWWLDVESANTWDGTPAANRAVLEGMTTALKASGARPGLYANRSDWAAIVGRVPVASPLHDLPTWLAGATTRSGAAENCTHTTLTGGGRIELTQYVPPIGTLDADLTCTVLPAPGRPTVTGATSVGARLTARAHTWPTGTRLAYQWLRDGRAIAGATGIAHVVERADRGSQLAVRVTATRAGSSRLVQVSAGRTVHR